MLPEDRIGRNITFFGRSCDHINVVHIFRPDLYRFEVRLEVYDGPA